MTTNTSYNCECGICTVVADQSQFRFFGEKHLRLTVKNSCLVFYCTTCKKEISFPLPEKSNPLSTLEKIKEGE